MEKHQIKLRTEAKPNYSEHESSYLFRGCTVFKIELGPPTFRWIKPRFHLWHGTCKNYEGINTLDCRSNAARIPDVTNKKISIPSNFHLALFCSNQTSRNILARPLLQLPINYLTWMQSSKNTTSIRICTEAGNRKICPLQLYHIDREYGTTARSWEEREIQIQEASM